MDAFEYLRLNHPIVLAIGICWFLAVLYCLYELFWVIPRENMRKQLEQAGWSFSPVAGMQYRPAKCCEHGVAVGFQCWQCHVEKTLDKDQSSL
jgi:hypothetical protein